MSSVQEVRKLSKRGKSRDKRSKRWYREQRAEMQRYIERMASGDGEDLYYLAMMQEART